MMTKRSIVLVDDDSDDREIFESACAAIGDVDVTGFENGEAALQTLPQMRALPDVIFLDLNMPRRSGVEILRDLKHSRHLSSVPVIIFSTSFDARVRAECSDLGALDVMEKPSCFDALCLKLRTVLLTL